MSQAAAGVVRVSTFQAKAGQVVGLVAAAAGNARDARCGRLQLENET